MPGLGYLAPFRRRRVAPAFLSKLVALVGRRASRGAPIAAGIGASLTVFVVLLMSADIVRQYESENVLERALASTRADVQSVATNIGGEFDRLNWTMSLIQEDYAAGREGFFGVAKQLGNRLNDGNQIFNGLKSWAIAGRDGIIGLTSNPVARGFDVTDRDYFNALERDPALRHFTSRPTISRVPPHQRLVFKSWTLRDRRGEFDGIVVTVATWRHLARELLTALGDHADRAFIVDSDKNLFVADMASWPAEAIEPPRSLALDALPASDLQDGPATLRLPGFQDWLAVTAPIPNSDLHVVATIREATILSGRASLSWTITGALALISSTVGSLAAALRHAWRRVQREKERAEAGDRAKASFLATMSHEIRTPMTAVIGMTDLLSAMSLPDAARKKITAIQGAGEQLLAIINDILDFMKLEHDELVLARHDFELLSVIRSVETVLTPQAVQRDLKLSVVCNCETPLYLNGDDRRLQQVLFNLIGNALKFTLSGGVELRVSRFRAAAPGRVGLSFEVEDTGIGFDQNDAESLFDPFTQAERTRREAVGGTGLGLAISKRLVEAMDGSIACRSQSNVGSVFSFSVVFDVGRPPRARAAKQPCIADRSLRVLVAEDALLNQELIAEVLAAMGHSCRMVANGVEATRVAASEAFDLLILDIGMPIMDGDTAIRRIRAGAGPNATTPAIALTANVLDSDRRRYLQHGFDQVVGKPIDLPALFANIEALTSDKPAEPAPSLPRTSQLPAEFCDDLAIDIVHLRQMLQRMPSKKLNEWVKGVIGDAEKTVDQLRRADDVAEASRIAHRMKGTAANFGLRAISEACATIETAGLATDVLDALEPLSQAIQQTRAAYEATLELDRIAPA